VVQVASVDEYHHAIVVADSRLFRRLRGHLSHHLISLAVRAAIGLARFGGYFHG
jgi:hypothetical protein